MPALPILLGWLVLAAEPTAAARAADSVPPGTPAELFDLGRVAVLRDSAARIQGFSSRSPLGARDGATVLAHAEGAGVVQRLWIADAAGPGGEKRRLRVTIDHGTEPVVDATLAELASGIDPRFPNPIAGARPGGFVSYVPIAFHDGCTITLGGTEARTYEVSVLALPTADRLTSFRAHPSPEELHTLRLAQALWREPEAVFSNEPSYSPKRFWRELSIRTQTEDVEFPVEGIERNQRLFALPSGPRTIRSFDLVIDPKTLDNWRSARLRVIWEGTDPTQSAIDVAASDFFALPERRLAYRSLVSGENENVWSNRLPMPYQRAASVMIDADGPIRGLLRIRTARGTASGVGYLRVSSRSAAGPVLAWGPETGRGHVVGEFVSMEGHGKRAKALDGTLSLMPDNRPLFERGTLLVQEFNAGWPDARGRLDLAQTFPLAGFPRYEQERDRWSIAAYRWRLTDPVVFERSIALRIESDSTGGAARPDALRATVFWYSERPGPAPAGGTR